MKFIEGGNECRKVFFTSDTHQVNFCHNNIIKYCKRPFLNDEEQDKLDNGIFFKPSFDSTQKMNQLMLDNINSVVKPNDVLWHLGDFCFGEYYKAREMRDKILCQNVYLIFGNHDKDEIGNLFADCFQQILISVNYQYLFLNHYPMKNWDKKHKGSWNLYGHVHSKNEFLSNDKQLDVGVDGHNFKPWTIKQIQDWMTYNFKSN